MKVLLVEPDISACQHLRAIVRELAQEVKVLEAYDRTAALLHVSNHEDVALLLADFHLARAVGLLSPKERRLMALSARLVVLSASPCYMELVSTIEQGAMAYLPVTAPRPVALAALQIVMAGDRYFPPDLLVGPQEDEWQAHPSVRPNLTSRQIEVLTHMAAGRSNKHIARELGMSTGTVKVHVTAILKALNASNRTEAVIWAQRGHRKQTRELCARHVPVDAYRSRTMPARPRSSG